MIFGNSDKRMDKPYKFLALKFYSSKEWMYNSSKKYRTVFDANEVSYLYCEFSFYNKLFDEETWNAKINLKAYSLEKPRKEICNLEVKKEIKADENIVYIREGWGNDELGSFWKEGEYVWEAYVDDVFAGAEKFYINNVGVVTTENNPYFDVVSVKIYEGDYEGWKQKERKYLKQINRETSRYIWIEFILRNKLSGEWWCELFYNFYEDTGLLKGHTKSIDKIDKNTVRYTYTFDRGWGSADPGSWQDSRYRADVVFMDTLVASLPFDSGAEEIEGTFEPLDVNASTTVDVNQKTTTEEKEEGLEELMAKLDALIGLENIKKQIKEHIQYIDFLKIRKEKGFEENSAISLHSVFTGNPGTGKTTVVKMLGKIYKQLGLLSKGHVHEVDRVDLVGEFIGQTAPKVRKAIDAARGGVLFIDEAYALAREGESGNDYGHEVVEILLKEMSDGVGDIAIMVAGYPHEMSVFLDSNPGLKSRFSYIFHFEDYSPDELMRIAAFAAKKRAIRVEPAAVDVLYKVIESAFRSRDKSFGNARFVYSLIDEAKMNMGLRLMKHPNIKSLSKEELEMVTLDDVKEFTAGSQKKKIILDVDEALLKEAITELNDLTGLDNIKNDINELVKLVRYYKEIGKDVMNKFSLHTIFTGNPGTGKTTVARIIGKIFKALGMLEKGHVIECDREALVAEYVGQTAVKTKKLIDASMDGVLFIDEAYSLYSKGDNDFGKEAIEVLLKNMEDQRGRFAVIVAGYPDNMKVFIESNPGLKSRFDRTFHFKDYLPEELLVIAKNMFSKENLVLSEEAKNSLKGFLVGIYENRDIYFGNARTVRQIVGTIIKNQNLRMASIPSSERTMEMIETVLPADVNFSLPESGKGEARPTIGFKKP